MIQKAFFLHTFSSSRLFLTSQLFFILLIIFLPTQLGLHFWPDYTRILGLRIDYLAPTIYLTDILSGLVLVFWLVEKITNKVIPVNTGIHVRTNKQSWVIKLQSLVKISTMDSRLRGNDKWGISIFWLGILVLFATLNIFLSARPEISLYSWLRILQFILIALYVRNNSDFVLKVLQTILPWQLVFLSLMAIAQVYIQSSLGGLFWWLGERPISISTPGVAKASFFGHLLLRPYATFSHPNSLAGYLLIGLILAITLIRKPFSMIRYSLFMIPVLALFLTFSRTAWFALAVVIILWTVTRYLRQTESVSRRISWLVLFVLVVSLVYPVIWLYLNSHLSTSFFESQSAQVRLQLFQSAWQMIRDHPYFGVGLGNFVPSLPPYLNVPTVALLQPVHHVFWLIVSETGLIGLIGTLWILFSLRFRPSKSIIHNSLFIILILITSSTDHYWLTLPQNRLLLAIVFGLLSTSTRNS